MKQHLLALLLALTLPVLAQTSDYPRHLEGRLTLITEFETLLTQLVQQIWADVNSSQPNPELYHAVEERLGEKADKLGTTEGLEPPESAAEAQEALEDCSRQAQRCLKELRYVIRGTEDLAWLLRHPTSGLAGNGLLVLQDLERVKASRKNLEWSKKRLRERLRELKPATSWLGPGSTRKSYSCAPWARSQRTVSSCFPFTALPRTVSPA